MRHFNTILSRLLINTEIFDGFHTLMFRPARFRPNFKIWRRIVSDSILETGSAFGSLSKTGSLFDSILKTESYLISTTGCGSDRNTRSLVLYVQEANSISFGRSSSLHDLARARLEPAATPDGAEGVRWKDEISQNQLPG